jgi:glycosyltransferase involved in cell wall biosynthesis
MADARIARKRLGISKWVYIRLYDRTNLAQANMIHYTAPGEQEHSLLKGRERATCVVPNPVEPLHVAADAGDADEGSPLPEGFLESDYILSVGRLAWTKGIDILIKAMGKLGEEYADVRLAVVGPDTENLQADLTALAAQEGVADRVFFLGTQKGTRLQRLYRSAKLVAAPALSEGFGNTVAEALLEGVPVVASDAVGLATFPEILEHIKVCDTGPASVGLAILLVLREQERWRESAAQACRVLKENFSARAVAARLVENYSGLRPGS